MIATLFYCGIGRSETGVLRINAWRSVVRRCITFRPQKRADNEPGANRAQGTQDSRSDGQDGRSHCAGDSSAVCSIAINTLPEWARLKTKLPFCHELN